MPARSATPVDHPVRTFAFAAGSVACFSVMNVFVKLATVDYSVAQIMFFRNALAFIPILALILRYGRISGTGLNVLKTKRWAGHLARSGVGIAAMGCYFISFSLLPLADATALHFAGPLILTLLSIPMLGERIGPWRWGAVLVGFAGVLFMLQPTGEGVPMGQIIALTAAALTAVAMIFVRKLGRTEHALAIVFYFTLFGMVCGLCGMFFMWQPLRPETFIYLVMTGLMGGVGQVLLTYAYAGGPAAYVAPFSYMAMVFSVAADVLIWSKWPDWHIAAGSVVIIASGLCIVWREARVKRQAAAPRTNVYGLQPAMPTEKDVEELEAGKCDRQG